MAYRNAIACLSILFPAWISPAVAETDSRVIHADAIIDGNVVVVGRLSKPFGTALEIECTVVEDRRLILKNPLVPPEHQQMSMLYKLEIQRVDGRLLDAPVVMEFEASETRDVRVAPSWHALNALVTRLTTPGARLRFDENVEGLFVPDPISVEEAEAFKRDYVGSRHTLIVYESARYEGQPENLPEGYSFFMGGAKAFGFTTYLTVLGEK
ncbi:MAG: hypothetical protein ACREIA_02225 [Opitutaceae bacterium]